METEKQDAKDREGVGAAGRRKMLAYRKLRLRGGDNERWGRGMRHVETPAERD